jgi:hypothetical protein
MLAPQNDQRESHLVVSVSPLHRYVFAVRAMGTYSVGYEEAAGSRGGIGLNGR